VGRIARTGSVHVPRLCAREAYPSVWQLVSEIDGTLPDEVGLTHIVAALFPSGSVTGAPKAEAMRVIGDLEARPRGPYCGAIGWVAPPSEPVRARFNVAIRTVAVDRTDGRAVYGTGGGITFASDPDSEYRELRLKMAVLSVTRDHADELELIETLAYAPGRGLRFFERHLARLAASARFFGFAFDEPDVRVAVERATAGTEAARVRLALRADGELTVDIAPLPVAPSAPVRIAIDTEPVRSGSLWLRHKTNRRSTYDAARTRHPDADDVVLVNEQGGVTETSIANIAVRRGGAWLTPPVEAGCLPGIGRAIALDEGRVVEAAITMAELHGADDIALISSLRGWRPAVLI
jgi:para-aminobenzoate synthetase / 4-amino-4-deoxychorismate lyase